VDCGHRVDGQGDVAVDFGEVGIDASRTEPVQLTCDSHDRGHGSPRLGGPRRSITVVRGKATQDARPAQRDPTSTRGDRGWFVSAANVRVQMNAQTGRCARHFRRVLGRSGRPTPTARNGYEATETFRLFLLGHAAAHFGKVRRASAAKGCPLPSVTMRPHTYRVPIPWGSKGRRAPPAGLAGGSRDLRESTRQRRSCRGSARG
jgi:hypothetical protein